MPSTSKKQHNFMAAVAHNPAFAKKAGVPQSVGKDFNEADKGRKFSKGGNMKMVNKGGKMVPHFAADGKGKMAHGGKVHKDVKSDKGMMQKAVNKHEGRLHKGQPMTKLNMGGMAYAKGGFTKAADGVVSKGKTKGTQIKMAMGGKAC